MNNHYAGIFIRALAYIADTAVLFGIFSLIHYFAFGTFFRHVSEFSLSFATHPVCLGFAVFYFLYFIFFEGLWRATPGKALFGLKVATQGAEIFSFKNSFIRNILRLIDGILFYLVGVVFILKSDKKQRLGDRIAQTVVLKG